MKAGLIVLSLACCVGLLYANPLQEKLNPEEPETPVEAEPQYLPDFELQDENDWEQNRPDKPDHHHHGAMPSHIIGNAYKSQGPFSGRLTNVVLNRKGVQKTVQRNKIEFNWDILRRHLKDLLEEEDDA